MYIYIHIYVCIYIHIDEFIFLYISVYIYIHVYTGFFAVSGTNWWMGTLYVFPCFRLVPNCLKHPAGPGQKLILGGVIWVVGVPPYLFLLQVPQEKFVYHNSKTFAIQTPEIWLMYCLHMTRCVLSAISPITAHQTTRSVNHTLPNWKNAQTSQPTKVMVLPYGSPNSLMDFGDHYIQCSCTNLQSWIYGRDSLVVTTWSSLLDVLLTLNLDQEDPPLKKIIQQIGVVFQGGSS